MSCLQKSKNEFNVLTCIFTMWTLTSDIRQVSRTSGICKIAIAQRRTQNAEAILISQSIIMARNGLEIYNSLLNTVICPCVHQRALVHCSVQLRASACTSRADVYTSRAVACSRVHFACSRVQSRAVARA